MPLTKEKCLKKLQALTEKFSTQLNAEQLSLANAASMADLLSNILNTTRDYFSPMEEFKLPIENTLERLNPVNNYGFLSTFMRDTYLGSLIEDMGCLFAFVAFLPEENSPRKALYTSLQAFKTNLTLLLNHADTQQSDLTVTDYHVS